MYPALTPVGKSSSWYSEKRSIQEKALEITYLEEKWEAKRLNDIQVSIPILIRGKAMLPSKITSIGEKDDEEEKEAMDEEEEMAAHATVSLQSEGDTFHNNMYDPQDQDDDNEGDDMRSQRFSYEIYHSESP